MKVKKLLISLTLAVIAIVITFSSSVNAATDVDIMFEELDLTSDPDSGTQYSIYNGAHVATKIGKDDGSGNFIRVLNAYCGKANHGFESREAANIKPDENIYTDRYNKKYYMNTEKSDISLYKTNETAGISDYNRILALADLFYLDDSNSIAGNTEYKNFIKNVLSITDINNIIHSNYSKYTDNDDFGYYHFIKKGNETHEYTLAEFEEMRQNGELEHITSDGFRELYLNGEPFYCYYYYDNGIEEVEADVKAINPLLITPEQIRAIQQITLWYYTNVNGTNREYDFTSDSNSFLFYKNSASESSYTFVGDGIDAQAKLIYNNLINKANANATADYQANNNVYLYLDTNNDPDDEQPIIEIEKVNKIFDLALRKYITEITRNGNNVSFDSRQPNIDTINTLDNGLTTADYKHRKDPLSVEKGDKVTYTLTIYNEGNIKGKATIIKDQLPTGLTFDKTATEALHGDNDNYTFSSEGNIITITAKDTLGVLDEYNGTLSSTSVQVVCTVVAQPDTISSKVLTNVAWIAKAYNAKNNEEYDGTEIGFDRDSAPGNHPEESDSTLPGYKGNNSNKNVEPADPTYHYKGQQDDDDFEKIILQPKVFDLALRKFITQIQSGDETRHYDDPTSSENRIPQIDGTQVNYINPNTELEETEETTAQKTHPKDAKEVAIGDKVTYKIRIYNEGQRIGRAAEVTDYLPKGLTLVPASQSIINAEYGWSEGTDEAGNRVIVSTYMKDNNILLTPVGGNTNFSHLNDVDGNNKPIYYFDLEVECIVNEEAKTGKNSLRNIAAITKYEDEDGNEISDIDSDKNPVTPNGYNPKNPTNGLGEQDDDDLEDLKLIQLDLALRKFITRVANNEDMTDATNYDRIPNPTNLDALYDGDVTTATYNHTKQPVKVKVGDYVEYTLRVYNEGSMDGYAKEDTNKVTYGWTVSEDGRTIKTNYLKDTKLNALKKEIRSVAGNSGIVSAIGMTEEIVLDSTAKMEENELKVICKVKDTIPFETNQTNIAEISLYGDKNGESLTVDRDSETTGTGKVQLPSDTDLPNYKNTEIERGDSYIPGQQDDDDFEKIYVEKFDLALRKFITKVEDEKNNKTRVITDRVPQLSIDETTGNIKYTHTKEPVYVVKENIVTYTLRIFNEGKVDGYASVITDDIPDGVKFIPASQNETNQKYLWKMYREVTAEEAQTLQNVVHCKVKENEEVRHFVETDDPDKATLIRTDYLSFENGQQRMREEGLSVNPNLIKAYVEPAEGETPNPSYKDIEVAFYVTEDYGSNRIITNFAQISDDQDEDGNPIDDWDSETDLWNPGEDDQDIENIRVPNFDLALRKWVTQSILIDGDEEEVKYTGNQPFDDPEEPAKVELHRRKINDVVVKFKYSIRVYNDGYDKETGIAKDGFIAGYAKEVKDHIPDGLRFVQEDNPDWTQIDEKTIVTNKLADTLLQPGEYADVEVILTWINSGDNLGIKVNDAEISKDENEWGVPDYDSTPDNMYEKHEDDDDNAPVLLSVSTGEDKTVIIISITIGFTALAVLAGGIFLIKK